MQKPLQQDTAPATATVQAAAAASPSLTISLRNHSAFHTAYAYLTGTDSLTNSLVLLRADGKTLYHPTSPSGTAQPLGVDCAIVLPAPGQTRTITLPTYIAGGRLWFSFGHHLVFLLNPGPGLVEPSVLNPADPNIHTNFGFCEFTYNAQQLFANISYVDFFAVPIALTLYLGNGSVQHVSGTTDAGLTTIANGLRAQQQADGQPWSSLIVQQHNGVLRILSPNSAISANPALFATYFDAYVNQVWAKYQSTALTVNTQASYGNVQGTTSVAAQTLTFPSTSTTLTKPSSHDIFSCSTGPFAITTANQYTAAAPIIPRVAAAFNRTTLLLASSVPDGANVSQYYTTNPTNHYARIVHAANLDGRGYAFPYDDVVPDGGHDQSGSVFGPAPTEWIVSVGGKGTGLAPAPRNV